MSTLFLLYLVNTFLILLLCNNRGCLSNLLHGLRFLANSPQYKQRAGGEGQTGVVADSNASDSSNCGGEEVEAAIKRWRPSLPPHRKDGLRNFRELLWYWTEYYLRRGRDRLSLEFSSHTHFEEWHCVVGE